MNEIKFKTKEEEFDYYGNIFKKEIEKIIPHRIVNPELLLCRCPFCGDSIKNSMHMHFYIGFVNKDVFLYDCKRCSSQGRITADLLKKLGIFNSELEEFVSRKKKYWINSNKVIKYDNERIPIFNLVKKINESDRFKVDYWENRTKIKLTQEAIETYRLIFNLEDFLSFNKISLYNYTKEQIYTIKELSKNFLGFLSNNNSIISFRAVRETDFRQKFNFVINENYKRPFYYIPKTSIDIMSKNPKIVLSEGPFDCIVSKNRFYDKDNPDIIFAACGGKAGYKRVLKEIIAQTGFINATIIFYSDSDVAPEVYTRDILGPFGNLLHGIIYYNTLAKDFGNMNDDVKLEIKKF